MPAPQGPPFGTHLTRVAKVVSGQFDAALTAAGGSLPVWLILMSLETTRFGNQRGLAAAIGIHGATLTHHLNAMERDGLLTRRRADDNRRVHVVELTETGHALFLQLRDAAVDFDRRLRLGFTPAELAAVSAALDRLASNVTD
ncbi:MarR family winged helix-turn-helix transcriptional regulator [Streptomyces sp. NPDC088197]|uniref:MarR family winged helix-turn-helix transcriptional regulator n=1 Tax=unclassified Streptomyces TaxID=2593676 RepID=UPI0036EBFBC0